MGVLDRANLERETVYGQSLLSADSGSSKWHRGRPIKSLS